jgi:hypothetical protein
MNSDKTNNLYEGTLLSMAVPRSRILDLLQVDCLAAEIFTVRLLIMSGTMSNLFPYFQPSGFAIREQSPTTAIKRTGPSVLLPAEDGNFPGFTKSISRLGDIR